MLSKTVTRKVCKIRSQIFVSSAADIFYRFCTAVYCFFVLSYLLLLFTLSLLCCATPICQVWRW